MLPRVLVAADRPALVERIVAVLARLDVLMRSTALARELGDSVELDSYDVVILGGARFVDVASALANLRALSPAPECVVINAQRNAEDAAAALAAGALGVLDVELGDDELRTALDTLIERARTLREVVTELELATAPSDALVVSSPKMAALIDLARRAAAATSTVLITGETGVGKERIAHLIHAESPRAHGPFIAINCAALPSELVESELFGHERGAFTGAHQSRRGFFELAHRGTLFLDEITELPPQAQAKLLRVLQDRELRPVGSDRLIPVDVRVVAATNRDPEAEVAGGRFRSDLYYRLRVIELELPPLRERPEDVTELLDTQLRRFNVVLGRNIRGFSPAARQALEAYAWPGNVRELINVIERAVLLCLGREITVEDLPRAMAEARPAQLSREAGGGEANVGRAQLGLALPEEWLRLPWRAVRDSLLREGERIYLSNLLRQTGGRVGLTAKRAGLAERSLFEKMKRHELRKEDFRPGRDEEE